MLILLAILILLLAPAAMAILHLVRPRSGYQWLIAIVTVAATFPLVMITRFRLPQTISLLAWQPETLLPLSPTLLIDQFSWPFILVLVTSSLSLLLTSVARLSLETPQENDDQKTPAQLSTHWRSWAANLVLYGLGLVTVTAGNPLALLMGWTALDLAELFTLLSMLNHPASRQRALVTFSSRLAGMGLILIAGILAWSEGSNLTFDAISPRASLFLLLAAGLRLGVLPPAGRNLYLPFQKEMPIRRDLGTALRTISWSASLALLVRTAAVIEQISLTPYLLALASLAALIGAWGWFRASDELNGRPYWILGTASLAFTAALRAQPQACLAWGVTSLLSGGLLFSFWPRHRILLPLALLGLLGLTAIPFSPAWNGAGIFQVTTNLTSSTGWLAAILILLSLLISQSLLVAGYLRHTFRPLLPSAADVAPIERWVWLIYPLGLALFVIANLGIGWDNLPQDLSALPLTTWIAGLAASSLALFIWQVSQRPRLVTALESSVWWARLLDPNRTGLPDWFYRVPADIYRTITRLVNLMSNTLEGEGGILWTFVLLALIFTFLQR
ncbi:MAG: hypothetical protein JW726_14195 [Anaerolineales bacterium]|nr:hypothetical protein [Anaerolineales bacterium]